MKPGLSGAALHRPNPSSNEQIGLRELLAMSFFLLGLKGTDTTPEFWITFGGNAAWMSALAGFAYVLPFLWLTARLLSAAGDRGIWALAEDVLGGGGVRLVFGLWLILFLLATVLNVRAYALLLEVMFFSKTPGVFLYGLFLIVAGYVAAKGIETVGRLASLLLPYALLGYVALFVGIFDVLDYREIYPLLGTGEKAFTGPLTHLALYVDLLYLALVADRYVGGARTYWRGVVLGGGLGALSIAALLFVYIAAFGYPAVNGLVYPFQQLTRLAHFGWYINHVEAIFLAIWAIAAVVHFAIYLYFDLWLLQVLLGAGAFQRLTIPLIGLLFVAGLYPYRSFTSQYAYRDAKLILLTAVVFPSLILIGVLYYRKARRGSGRGRRRV
ncbi:MAG: spore germination protein [Hydrogenibacillus schlegelii]|uniref:Spore germination protein n=1 Tax=Hydrogenibacillus schlegelii TaxID=1484 RepID=A0A2T5GF39_HYDSH|nr:GerAB/ArcD/ProY family transporter [Hydrogenibacillus schlegelii]PTQ54801.1 MAG: spore germination protein [Hydrogenibacillus schlegelii]